MQARHTDTIQSWLTVWLAEHLGLAPEDIDVGMPFRAVFSCIYLATF